MPYSVPQRQVSPEGRVPFARRETIALRPPAHEYDTVRHPEVGLAHLLRALVGEHTVIPGLPPTCP